MCVVECARDWAQQTNHSECVITDAGTEHFVQGLAGDHLGHQVGTVAGVGELVKTRDGRVLEGDVRTQLEQEPPRKAHIAGDRRLDGAQSDAAGHTRMLGLVDHTEAVGLELTHDAVAADL